jgi:hypothetical protein
MGDRALLTSEATADRIEPGADFSEQIVIEVSKQQQFIGRAIADFANRSEAFNLQDISGSHCEFEISHTQFPKCLWQTEGRSS